MSDVFTYLVDLPTNIHEMVVPCPGGYTVYLRAGDTREMQMKSYQHAIEHVSQGDFDKSDVQIIEADTHEDFAG